METFKSLKIQKGQIISAEPLKFGQQADFSPKWWGGGERQIEQAKIL